MPKPQTITTSLQSANGRAQLAEAFSELEPDICSMQSASRMNELLISAILKTAKGDDFPASTIKDFERNGFKVYVLTEIEDDVLHHAIYHAGAIARDLYKRWHDACEGA